jgi:transcriptional regulator with XRE-family HTH domain
VAVLQPSPFAALLKRYRLSAGLTQEELAEGARLSVRGISDLERGVTRRKLKTLYRCASHSGVTNRKDSDDSWTTAVYDHADRTARNPTLKKTSAPQLRATCSVSGCVSPEQTLPTGAMNPRTSGELATYQWPAIHELKSAPESANRG